MFKLLFISLLLVPSLLAEAIKNIIVFGDSYSDVGNYQRLTNGPLWSENLAAAWDASLYSFAFSGAVCNNSVYPKQTSKQYIPSIEDQLEMYYHQNLNLNPQETVVAIWVGVNDIYKTFEMREGEQQANLKRVVDCISSNVRNARRIFSTNKFIVFGVPPLEKIPYYADSPLRLSREQAANELNEYLLKEVQKMNKHLQSVDIDFMDIHQLLDHIVQKPNSFNIKNAVDAYWDACQGQCSDDINSYVWWDKAHLTGGVHRLIADSIAQSGSFATEMEIPKDLDVNALLNNADSKFKSPRYEAKANTGEIDRLIEKMNEEKQMGNPNIKIDGEAEQEGITKEKGGINSYVYFGVAATVIVCIGFVLFNKRAKNRTSHLASLSNLLKKEDRGRFVPLRNIDSDV
ncbi:hypothetical protein G6F46_003004 [Rhizopus delemar]|uniref:SGNH hydrolase-type esterase domain-containing protein n=2 Tax=Rhizopus TaxID=4842 RepID=A0A9P7CT59_9FUNG|nr:hypothetical protein G6F55_001739 [Rhizopus delemar]KAG1551670.1 hypothetical protein G6F51_001703 [Rhizopus arrhizus]KAG1504010.1 hypothetical protein G6F54_001296 [Rhizopus delemar]KAG1517332.1 hypothetical protein G6F53_001455 [Rhizopus delemar]KAG1528737.1 hypothetical protein G6F52_000385 [Rhizopus delemar]